MQVAILTNIEQSNIIKLLDAFEDAKEVRRMCGAQCMYVYWIVCSFLVI
jgi:hypothetical protein